MPLVGLGVGERCHWSVRMDGSVNGTARPVLRVLHDPFHWVMSSRDHQAVQPGPRWECLVCIQEEDV